MHPSALEKSPAMPAPVVTTGRYLRLVLFRGIALWLIFLDHIPSNVVAWGTIRNYGFSDATEIFVFVSGYTAAFVYGKEMRERGFMIAGAHILRRCLCQSCLPRLPCLACLARTCSVFTPLPG